MLLKAVCLNTKLLHVGVLCTSQRVFIGLSLILSSLSYEVVYLQRH